MRFLGLSIAVLVFLSMIVLLGLICVMINKKKYEIANHIVSICLLHFFFSFAFLTYSLVIMNGSYDIVYDTQINLTILFVIFILFGLLFLFFGYILNKRVAPLSSKKLDRVRRSLLLPLTYFLLMVNIYLFYLNVYHFYLLSILV